MFPITQHMADLDVGGRFRIRKPSELGQLALISLYRVHRTGDQQ